MGERLSRAVEPAALVGPHPPSFGDCAVGLKAVAMFVVAQLHRGDQRRGVSRIHRPRLAGLARVAGRQHQNLSAVARLDAGVRMVRMYVTDLASFDGPELPAALRALLGYHPVSFHGPCGAALVG